MQCIFCVKSQWVVIMTDKLMYDSCCGLCSHCYIIGAEPALNTGSETIDHESSQFIEELMIFALNYKSQSVTVSILIIQLLLEWQLVCDRACDSENGSI